MPAPLAGAAIGAASLIRGVFMLGRVMAISAAMYFAGNALVETSENIQETITPTSDLPEGRKESFSLPLSISIAITALAVVYAYDKVVKPFLPKKRRK